jgi:hypothetical protein
VLICYSRISLRVYVKTFNSFLVNKTNRRTEFHCYWYSTLHVSANLAAHHQEFKARSRMELQFHPAPGSKRSSNCIKCTNADVRLRNPDDGQKGCPKHVES